MRTPRTLIAALAAAGIAAAALAGLRAEVKKVAAAAGK